MTETKWFHNELKRTVDDTIGGEMVYRCTSNDCFGIFAVRALDFPESTTGIVPVVNKTRASTDQAE
jgi:hypothetical protein